MQMKYKSNRVPKIEPTNILGVKIPVWPVRDTIKEGCDRLETTEGFFLQCIVNLHAMPDRDMVVHKLVHKLCAVFPDVTCTKRLTLAFIGVMAENKYLKIKQHGDNTYRNILLTKKLTRLKVCERMPDEGILLPTKKPVKVDTGRVKVPKEVKETLQYIADYKLCINTKMLDFLSSNTPTEDNENKQNLITISLRKAKLLRDETFFRLPHYLDSRSRDYARIYGINPQGSDIEKSLLKGHVAEVLTTDGYNALIETLNSYSERPEWVESDHIAHATDPVLNDTWKEANDPYCYLASCFTLLEYKTDPKKKIRANVPLDGKCNGLQHWSALMRSSSVVSRVGMVKEVSLLDLYQYVSKGHGEVLPKELVEYACRASAKKPSMTLCYGATQSSIRESFETLYGKGTEAGLDEEAISILSNAMWEVLSGLLPEITKGMKFLQTCARTITKEVGTCEIQWPLYDKVMISQNYDEGLQRDISIRLPSGNDFAVQYREFQGNVPRTSKASTAMAPNFVHGMDATHLRMVAKRLKDLGIPSCYIHDSFSVHVNYRKVLYDIIVEEFIDLYSEDTLKRIKNYWEMFYSIELPEVPEYGDYDVRILKDSEVFFA